MWGIGTSTGPLIGAGFAQDVVRICHNCGYLWQKLTASLKVLEVDILDKPSYRWHWNASCCVVLEAGPDTGAYRREAQEI